MSVLAALILTLLYAACNGQWMTEYEKPFKIECPIQQIVKSLGSQYDNGKKDRVWNMTCMVIHGFRYVNNFDQLLAYQCPGERVIAGLESIQDIGRKDRKYSFKCCVPEGAIAHSCLTTQFLNEYKQLLNYRPPDGFGLKGVYSVHDNIREDRIFRFRICRLDKISILGIVESLLGK